MDIYGLACQAARKTGPLRAWWMVPVQTAAQFCKSRSTAQDYQALPLKRYSDRRFIAPK